jgi:hypothetical protein
MRNCQLAEVLQLMAEHDVEVVRMFKLQFE